MQVSIAEYTSHGSSMIIAIVPSEFTACQVAGDAMVKRIHGYFRTMPVMLVSIEDNGLRAYAAFQTHMLLALIQLEMLELRGLDLSLPPPEDELPF
jgi:hypothetical protein